MPFKRRATTRRGKPARRSPARFSRSRSSRGRPAAKQKPQTVRIVIEQPQPQVGMPTQLPSGVGNVVPLAPRRNRF